MASLLGKTLLNRYHVQEFLGRGGMAEVYKVWDNQRMTYLAIKVLLDDLALDKVFIRRFTREANTLEKLQHPNIVRFFGFERDNLCSFMLMDYVEGETLRHLIHDAGGRSVPYGQIREVMRSVCGALNYAHNLGFVHTDIKPANIMIDNNGFVKLADFGMAHMAGAATATMVGAGTPAYMAPEQIEGQEPVLQTDIYALGIVLYEMFTGGERPFTGEQSEATGGISDRIRWEHLNLQPPSPRKWSPALSSEIEKVILKCLSKDPEKRYQSTIELWNALDVAIGDVQDIQPTSRINVTQSARLERPHKPLVKRFPLLSVATLVFFLILLVSQKEYMKNIYGNIVDNITNNISVNGILWMFGIATIIAGLTSLSLRYRTNFISRENKILDSKKDKSEATEDGKKGLTTEYLLSAVDPLHRHGAIRLIGRKQELRLKDIIVQFGGGRYLLRGYGKFGSTALVEQIIDVARQELLEKHAQKSTIISIRLELPELLNSQDTVLALIRELRVEASRQKIPKHLHKKLKVLDPKSKVETIKSTNTQAISFKTAPVPNIEATLSRKTDKEPRQNLNVLSSDTLFQIISDFLEQNDTKNLGKLDTFVERVLRVRNMATRVVIVLEKITSPDVFKTLYQLRLLDNKNITVLAFVSQETYQQWSAKTLNTIALLGFSNHYVPSLWEDKTQFVEMMMRETFVKSNQKAKELDFKDHIAYLTRGAPGTVVTTLLSPKYAEFDAGIPSLNLTEIGDWEIIEHNAIKQRLLDASWGKILKNHFVGKEARDQARMGIYEIMDWIDKEGGFTLDEIKSFANKAEIKIAEGKYPIEKTLDTFIIALVEANYLNLQRDMYILNRYKSEEVQ